MTDGELSRYITKLGDRIAVRQYCKIEVQDTGEISKAVQSLRAKLNGRIDKSNKLIGNSNALKTERRFQLGMFEKAGQSFVQVRERRGGGIRHLKAPKSTTMAEIKEMGKELFFPRGKCTIGNVDEFDFSIRDFTEELLDPSATLGDQYELRKVKILRLYISAERKTNTVFVDVDDIDELDSDDLTEETFMPHDNQTLQASASETPALLVNEVLQVSEEEQASQISIDEEIQIGYVLMDDDVDLDDTLPMEVDNMMLGRQTALQPPRVTRIKLRRGHVFQDLNAAFQEGTLSVDDTLVEVEMVLPNGSIEKGEDNGGVLRDALSEYWDAFMTKCTTGSTSRIPMTRHDMTDTWKIVAKVMVLGYNVGGYFPIMLAKPFMKHCLGQEVKSDDLWETFLQCITNEEKNIAEQAMQDFSSVDGSDEWLDFLDAHEVKILVSETNCKKTLHEVAHKEIIQDPAYISDCWNEELKNLRLPSGGIDEVLGKLNPSSRKVISVLQPEENMSKRDQTMFDFLKKYIRTCSESHLKKFLRFCTGMTLRTPVINCYVLAKIIVV